MAEQSTCRLLLIEDNPGDARLFQELLRGGRFDSFELEHAERLSDAIACLHSEKFDIVVLDLSLPDAVGLEGLVEIQTIEPATPVVVISGLVEEEIALQAVRSGAQDYLLKGHIDELLLPRCLRYAIERGQLQEKLANLAQIDDLTGLVNRGQFNVLLENAVNQTQRSDRLVGLLLIDLDGFKTVNDTFGHLIGDQLLQIAAQRLLDCARSSDSVARLGGDEFAVIATNNDAADGVAAFAQRIIDRLSAPFLIDGNEITIGASVGINLYPIDSSDSDGLLRHADIALYRAKEQGRGQYKIFDEDMDRQVRASRSLESDLRRALAQGEIELYYQPQISLRDHHVVGMEALMRWNNPQRGLVSPGEFLPLAEKSHLITDLDGWALETAARQTKVWQQDGLPSLTMSVNVSAANFQGRSWAGDAETILRTVGLDPDSIELEITESVAMSFRRDVISMIERLASFGVGIVIDDFGTGFSSLTHLKHLPIHRVKIDQSFVQGMVDSAQDAAICFSVIHLAHSLQMGVVAEGIETKEQLSMLADNGCDVGQGYYFAKPMPADAATKFLRSHLDDETELKFSATA